MRTRQMSPTTWNRQFAKRLRELLGPNYPIPRDDWSTAEFYRRCEGMAPKAAAEKLASHREQAVAERRHCKAWREDDGTFRCEPCVPPAVLLTVQAAVEGGCRHGTVKHWENAYPGHRTLDDVRPVLFCWELL